MATLRKTANNIITAHCNPSTPKSSQQTTKLAESKYKSGNFAIKSHFSTNARTAKQF